MFYLRKDQNLDYYELRIFQNFVNLVNFLANTIMNTVEVVRTIKAICFETKMFKNLTQISIT